jgi:hypothetical protein
MEMSSEMDPAGSSDGYLLKRGAVGMYSHWSHGAVYMQSTAVIVKLPIS